MQTNLLWPVWLIAAVLAALLAAIAAGTLGMRRKGIAPRWVALLAVLRVAACALLALALVQPVWTFTRSEPQRPELLVLIDTSASMGQPGAKSSRLDDATAALRDGDLGAALRSRFQPHWFRFDRSARRIDGADLASLQPSGAATQVANSLQAALDALRAQGIAPQRVLLASDGHDQGDDPVALAQRHGVAIDTLRIDAMAKPPANLTLVDVQGSRRVLLGSETQLRVTLRGGPATKATLVLFDGPQLLQETPVTFEHTDRVLTLAHRPATTGAKTYEVRVLDGTNVVASRKLAVQVVDSKYEMLVLEDTWRWEYKHLQRLLEDDPSFRFTALLSRGGAGFVQFGSPDRRVNQVGFPQGRADLEGFDLFFLGDVAPSRWPRGLPAALARLVAEDGRSLIVVAGPNLGQLAGHPDLHALLPVDLTADSGKPVAGPVETQLRPDAQSSPFFFQWGDALVDKLPPLDQIYPVLRKRAGATVLLEAAKHRNAYGPLIVMAEHTVGRGRVLFIGADTLWKWHTLAPGADGPTPYGLFWQQALRAFTPAKSRTGPMNLWLTQSRSASAVGQAVEIVAETQADQAAPRGEIQAAVQGPDGRRLPLSFVPTPANPRRQRAEFAPQSPGLHTVVATLQAEGKTVAEGQALLQVETSTGEQDDGVDIAALQRLAAATGGQVVRPGDPATFPAAASDARLVDTTRTFDAWNGGWLLVLLCAMLGVDWFVRLFKGLA